MTTDRDPRTRIVLAWLREEQHENAERVLLRALDEVDTTPQRRSWWPAWRTVQMNAFAKVIAAAAAVLAVAVVGYTLFPGLGTVGPGARPSPLVIARDTWLDYSFGQVEFEATLDGPSVTGQLTLGREVEPGYLVVDLLCVRTREDGLLAIGGYVRSGSGPRLTGAPEGTLAGIVFPGGARPQLSRSLAGIWVGPAVGYPETQTTDCLEYLDAQLLASEPFPWFDYRSSSNQLDP